MKIEAETDTDTRTEAERFKDFAKKIIAVPKKEIDEAERKELAKKHKKRAPYKHIAS